LMELGHIRDQNFKWVFDILLDMKSKSCFHRKFRLIFLFPIIVKYVAVRFYPHNPMSPQSCGCGYVCVCVCAYRITDRMLKKSLLVFKFTSSLNTIDITQKWFSRKRDIQKFLPNAINRSFSLDISRNSVYHPARDDLFSLPYYVVQS